MDDEVERLRKLIDEARLNEAQREVLNHALNTRFYYARVRSGDRRELQSVQRVFGEQARDFVSDLQKRIEALKK